jgi:glycosyltransferase involved in cell wall biosynthesis
VHPVPTSTPSDTGSTLELSVVVPVYGCRECLFALHQRLRTSVASVTQSFELIFVDDRSPDGAWETLTELARSDPSVKALRLSRNFGQHAAITAGMARSRGRWTVVMDCDLEEPPEVIPRLYERALQGYEVVQTTRTRRHVSPLRRMLGRVYITLRSFLTETPVGNHQGTLSILSRKVVDAYLQVRDHHREYLMLVEWLGFRSTSIEYEPAPRPHGRSSYTLSRLIRVAVDGMFFQTTILLRWIVMLGLLVALSGVALAGFYLYTYIFDDPLPGYTSIVILLLLLSAFIIVSLGVVGLYVGKVFEQVKGRPLFVVDAELSQSRSSVPPEERVPEVALPGWSGEGVDESDVSQPAVLGE